MRRLLAALVAVFLCSCASTVTTYRACVEEIEGGRVLHDPGTVLGEVDDDTGHWLVFQGAFWPHPINVKKVNRFCKILRPETAERSAPPPPMVVEP